jgi:hypothetical protein
MDDGQAKEPAKEPLAVGHPIFEETKGATRAGNAASSESTISEPNCTWCTSLIGESNMVSCLSVNLSPERLLEDDSCCGLLEIEPYQIRTPRRSIETLRISHLRRQCHNHSHNPAYQTLTLDTNTKPY